VVLPVDKPMTESCFRSICPMIRQAAIKSKSASFRANVIFILFSFFPNKINQIYPISFKKDLFSSAVNNQAAILLLF
jgi:hypothetical protein